MSDNPDYIKDEYIIPELMVTITSYELIGDKWVASISHSFHAHDQETLYKLIEAHKTIDPYFAASFTGKFEYYGGTIYLKNSEATVQYP